MPHIKHDSIGTSKCHKMRILFFGYFTEEVWHYILKEFAVNASLNVNFDKL